MLKQDADEHIHNKQWKQQNIDVTESYIIATAKKIGSQAFQMFKNKCYFLLKTTEPLKPLQT